MDPSKKLASDKSMKEKHLINDPLRKGSKNDEATSARKFAVRGFKTKLKPGLTTRWVEDMLDQI